MVSKLSTNCLSRCSLETGSFIVISSQVDFQGLQRDSADESVRRWRRLIVPGNRGNGDRHILQAISDPSGLFVGQRLGLQQVNRFIERQHTVLALVVADLRSEQV